MNTHNKIIKYTTELCKEYDAELLYLTKFGSHLYGTDTPESDTDYKGIFLPSKKSCFLGKMSKSITRSSGDSGGKNTKEDIDIQLWSLQYFLELVSNGETNALDLLFSHTNTDCVYMTHVSFFDQRINILDLMRKYNKLFDIKNCKAYTGYAIRQAKKYGIKGSRLGVIKRMYEWLKSIDIPGYMDDRKLSDLLWDMKDPALYDSSYCFPKELNGNYYLFVCGKAHQDTISAREFADRIYKEYDQYGDRARLAEKNEGIDWKAMSHAVRALFQMRELIETGKIQYPLCSAPVIKQIKNGEKNFSFVEEMITSMLKDIDYELEHIKEPLNKLDIEFVSKSIMDFYE